MYETVHPTWNSKYFPFDHVMKQLNRTVSIHNIHNQHKSILLSEWNACQSKMCNRFKNL